ncbi:MAG: 16S rRNA (cytidine(1402)-2'-O)-methyltransferase [Bryobacterales bacterium]|nr:16S rRNA (cytidine(1402)-2'-O)-methyltransferase [Bryobacterales bacterium]
MPAALYLVATPIGNLEDISLRAIRILKDEVDRIACEDTRHSRKLLVHYGINKPLVSYHEHNERDRGEELLAALLAGEKIALISDAGTPLISDPGYRLVAAAAAAGIPIIPIPGASAILTALCASGLPTDAFAFGGFLPPKQGQRRKALEAWAESPATLVFYEAPHRILEALADIETVLGERPVVLARELTKLHEEFLRGTARQVRDQLSSANTRGEMVILIGRGVAGLRDDRPLPEAVADAIRGGMDRMDAIKHVARQRGLSKREVYKASTAEGQ